jgi:hypothetical protein
MGSIVDSLDEMPLLASTLLLVGGATVFAMLGSYLVRRFVPVERLVTNNEVAGFKFAALGAVYAVLLAFAVFVVWESFRDAEACVTREAGALASAYRLSFGIEGPAGSGVRAALEEYVHSTVTDDWPAMIRGGGGSPVSNRALSKVYAAALAWQPETNRESAILSAMLDQLDGLTGARRERLGLATGVVPDMVWWSLFVGALLTIGFTFFFGSENLAAQVVMSGMLAMSLAVSLLVVVSLDRPFAGAVMVGPKALTQVLVDFGPGGAAVVRAGTGAAGL